MRSPTPAFILASVAATLLAAASAEAATGVRTISYGSSAGTTSSTTTGTTTATTTGTTASLPSQLNKSLYPQGPSNAIATGPSKAVIRRCNWCSKRLAVSEIGWATPKKAML